MFDRTYFEEHVVSQLEQLGAARVSVFLHNGTELKLKRIHKALDGYVLLEVYPEEGVNENTKQKRRKAGGTDEVFWDRVALPYESVTSVWLSVTDPDDAQGQEPKSTAFSLLFGLGYTL